MRIYINKDHITLGAETQAEKLQIENAKLECQRFKIAYQDWSESICLYTKSMQQWKDEKGVDDQ